MALVIYNSLTRKKEEFRPLRKGRVTMYACGPTVYDEPHIGHARGAYIFDMIFRYFKFKGYRITYARNITDIDDKIIDKANSEITQGKYPGKNLKKAVKAVANKYTRSYHQAMDRLGLLRPTIEPKATRWIKQMQRLVRLLVNKKYAYVSGNNVYFSILQFPEYGRLSGQNLDDLASQGNLGNEVGKREPLDFALWKAAKPDEPTWKSPWGLGRPGWHIECSTMSMQLLGNTFDIHGGGRDLIFPHHENEIAQSEAYSGRPFAKYWIHNGLLTINGQKMAKSLGNFVSMDEILAAYHPDIIKLFFLSAHYSHPIDYSKDKMEEAKKARERFFVFFEKVKHLDCRLPGLLKARQNILARFKPDFDLQAQCEKFSLAMDDDFNTPQALGSLFEMVTLANKFIQQHQNLTHQHKALLALVDAKIFELGSKVFGLFAKPVFISPPIKHDIKKLVSERAKLRKQKQYQKADEVRQEIYRKWSGLEIILEDQKDDSTSWRIRER